MNVVQRLDILLDTSDSGFNEAMQEVIWQNNIKADKIDTYAEGLIEHMEVLHKVFFYCLDHYKKPYNCIKYIKECAADNDNYLLCLVDSILNLMTRSDKGESMAILFGQLIDYRHDLSPWDKDEKVIEIQKEIDESILNNYVLPEQTYMGEDQTTHNNTEEQIRLWEYRMGEFIYIATRYSIDSVYAEVKPGYVFSSYFQSHVTDARTFYERFKHSLRKELIAGNVNVDFYRKDIGNRFLPKIKNYEEWYNIHKAETEIFGHYNPYQLMWNVIESTRDEIYKFFPELQITISSSDIKKVVNDSPKLTHSQIAILHHYNKLPITPNNADDIARKHGQTSGQRLGTIYKDLTSELVRTSKGKNRVKDIEAVLPLLTGVAKALAERELKVAIVNNKR